MGRRALPGSTTWPSAMRSPSASAPSVRGASPQPSLHVRLRVCHLGREVPCCTEHEAWRDPLWRTRVLMSHSVGAGRGKRDYWTRSALPPPKKNLGVRVASSPQRLREAGRRASLMTSGGHLDSLTACVLFPPPLAHSLLFPQARHPGLVPESHTDRNGGVGGIEVTF